jgi:SAM-dependent methyltransferase
VSRPKQWGAQYASIFKDESVVRAYRHRPPYPLRVFEILASLIDDEPRAVLDAGCGTGFVARTLVRYVDRVDAVDFSRAMISTGRKRPGGDDPGLRWICGPMETVTLRPPYTLIVAASSLHWMEWDVVLPRFRAMLSPKSYLALVEEMPDPNPWDAEVGEILSNYSMNTDFRPYDMMTVVGGLESRGLFRKVGAQITEPAPFRQSVAGWIESFHARNGFSRDRMSPQTTDECDRKLRETIVRYRPEGMVEQEIAGRVILGKPTACNADA